MLEVPGEGPETVTPSFSVRDVATRDDSYFRLKMGVLAPGGELTPDRFRVLVGNGGDELIALQYEVIDGARRLERGPGAVLGRRGQSHVRF